MSDRVRRAVTNNGDSRRDGMLLGVTRASAPGPSIPADRTCRTRPGHLAVAVRQQVRDSRVEHPQLGKGRVRIDEARAAALVADATAARSPTPPGAPIDAAALGPTLRSLGARRSRPFIRRDPTGSSGSPEAM